MAQKSGSAGASISTGARCTTALVPTSMRIDVGWVAGAVVGRFFFFFFASALALASAACFFSWRFLAALVTAFWVAAAFFLALIARVVGLVVGLAFFVVGRVVGAASFVQSPCGTTILALASRMPSTDGPTRAPWRITPRLNSCASIG